MKINTVLKTVIGTIALCSSLTFVQGIETDGVSMPKQAQKTTLEPVKTVSRDNFKKEPIQTKNDPRKSSDSTKIGQDKYSESISVPYPKATSAELPPTNICYFEFVNHDFNHKNIDAYFIFHTYNEENAKIPVPKKGKSICLKQKWNSNPSSAKNSTLSLFFSSKNRHASRIFNSLTIPTLDQGMKTVIHLFNDKDDVDSCRVAIDSEPLKLSSFYGGNFISYHLIMNMTSICHYINSQFSTIIIGSCAKIENPQKLYFMEIANDGNFVHFIVRTDGKWSIHKLVKLIKKSITTCILDSYPQLNRETIVNKFWTDEYIVKTIGVDNSEKYLSQYMKDRDRKYNVVGDYLAMVLYKSNMERK